MPGLSFAKAERAKRAKSLAVGLDYLGLHARPVTTAVGMAKVETCGDAPFDDELPAMHRAMVRRAQDDQAIWIVVAALGAKLDVVDVEKDAVATERDDAASVISSHDLAPGRGRNFLARSRRGFTHVGLRALRFVTHVGRAGVR